MSGELGTCLSLAGRIQPLASGFRYPGLLPWHMVLGLHGSEAGDEGVTPVLSPLGCDQGIKYDSGHLCCHPWGVLDSGFFLTLPAPPTHLVEAAKPVSADLEMSR